MNQLRWLLILDDLLASGEPDRRYRLWLVELDENSPSAPVKFDTLDKLYEALFARQQRAAGLSLPDEQPPTP